MSEHGWLNLVAVALGSASGGVARYWVSGAVNRWVGAHFPWGTLAVNVTGAALAGMFTAFLAASTPIKGSFSASALLIVGFCGSYTTVSSFALQTFVLAREGRWGAALSNIFISFLLSILAAGGALYLAD
jgi:CrcB protein